LNFMHLSPVLLQLVPASSKASSLLQHATSKNTTSSAMLLEPLAAVVSCYVCGCSVVRMRSTCLEQQSFEALMLELDANLLLAAALGHRYGQPEQ
jgi:hypothetical protein